MLPTSGHTDAGAVEERPAAFAPAWPRRFLPLVRQLSRRLTPILLRLPVTPNHITLAAIVGNPDAAEQVREWLEDPEKLDLAADDDERVPSADDDAGEEADEEEDLDLDDDDGDEEEDDEDDGEEAEEDD